MATIVPRFYRNTIGKKAVMAVTGVILTGWIIGHVLGNVLIFRGPGAVNQYAALLKSNMALLWGLRVFMLVTLVLHVVAAVQLVRQQRGARGVGYRRQVPQESTFASRTIRWGGLVLALFLIYHILHLTTGTVHPAFSHTDVYTNMVLGLRVPWVAAIYLVAVGALGLHLYHGMWSVFQSLGFAGPAISPTRRRLATGIAIFVYIGFTAIPLAILLRFLDLR